VSARQRFIDAYNRESATTIKVLRAYPQDKGELKPHHLCRTAKELAWIFVGEQGMCHVALTTGFDWSKPPSAPPPAPDSLDEIIRVFDGGRQSLVESIHRRDENLTGTVAFPTGPGTISDVPLEPFLWMTLFDQIHHRGQFSIYLRMADGKVPAIYGPTHDEPWF
jgi:uncharacterized damage-inducible protein DinB